MCQSVTKFCKKHKFAPCWGLVSRCLCLGERDLKNVRSCDIYVKAHWALDLHSKFSSLQHVSELLAFFYFFLFCFCLHGFNDTMCA